MTVNLGPKKWLWRFLGFETLDGNQPVQDWFDGLTDAARDDLLDTLGDLQVLPNHLWRRPKFDKLEDDISEIIGWTSTEELRIYGYFPGNEQTYTFLNGNSKKVGNDRQGKHLAKQRLGLLRANKATTHEFKFRRNSTGEGEQK
jgi:hypothetical protein